MVFLKPSVGQTTVARLKTVTNSSNVLTQATADEFKGLAPFISLAAPA